MSFPPPASSKTMKWRTRSRNRRLLEHALEQHLQLGQCRRRPASRPSIVRHGLNHSLPGAERADPRLHAVGDDQQLR